LTAGNWEISEVDIVEGRTPVRVDRVPPGQQGTLIDELVEVFSFDDSPLFNLGSLSLFVFDPNETAAEFVIRIRDFLRIDAPQGRFYLADDNSVERYIEGYVKIADLLKSGEFTKKMERRVSLGIVEGSLCEFSS
jgi:hypothetical protein